MIFITFLRKLESFLGDSLINLWFHIKIVKSLYTKIFGFKPILVNIKLLSQHHGNLLYFRRVSNLF